MRGEFNGLQALIAKDCPSAYYVNCFAHRLQLALVASANANVYLERFFTRLTWVVNIVTASCKRSDELKAAQASDIEYVLSIHEIETGKGKNQVGTIPRPGDTRWSSHLRSVSGLLNMYSAACSVLLDVLEVGKGKKGEALSAHEALVSFEFVFILHLMKKMLEITDILCQSLQCKTQDILNAMEMVLTTKALLQELRDTKFDYLLSQVKSFCEARNIDVPNLDAQYVSKYEKARNDFSVRDRYRIDIFYTAIDSQLQELNRRFSDPAIELLRLSSTLCPNSSSSTFNIDDICKLVEKFYPGDFSRDEKEHLKVELQFYEHRVVKNVEYKDLKTMSSLCEWLVRKNMSRTFQLVYRVIVLVLTLPVSTASAERSFSAMKLIKTCLRNKMEDGFLTDAMMLYVEKDIASTITTNSIINIFAKKGTRRVPFC